MTTTTRGELMRAPAWRYHVVPLAGLDSADLRATPVTGLPVGYGKHIVDSRTSPRSPSLTVRW
jgi:hypothetical protein